MIRSVSIDGKNIQRVLFDRLIPAVEGEDVESTILALYTLAVMMMNPGISTERLQEVVMATSQYLMMMMYEGDGKAN